MGGDAEVGQVAGTAPRNRTALEQVLLRDGRCEAGVR